MPAVYRWRLGRDLVRLALGERNGRRSVQLANRTGELVPKSSDPLLHIDSTFEFRQANATYALRDQVPSWLDVELRAHINEDARDQNQRRPAPMPLT